MAASADSAIQNFQESPVKAIAGASPERRFANGVLCLELRGRIGDDEAISLRSVTERLAHRNFDHLHVRINSTGGDVREGFSLYQYFRSFPVPISTEAVDRCYSMAMVLLMAGDFRFALSEAELLNHPTSSKRETLPEIITAANLRERAELLDQRCEQIAGIFAARTGYPVEWFRNEAKTENLMEHSDAIQAGILHESVGLPQRINPAWEGIVKTLPAGFYLPQYLRSKNYLNACKCAASLYEAAP